MSNNHHIDIETVKKQLIDGFTVEEIAQSIGCHVSTVYSNLRKHNLSIEEILGKFPFKNEQWLRKQFELYKTPYAIAQNTGVPRTSIARYGEKFGIYNVNFHRKPKNYIDEEYFKDIDTEHKAYWLGFIMADGCMYQKNNGKYEFSFKLKSTDYDIIRQLALDVSFDVSKIIIRQGYRKKTLIETATLRTSNQIFCNYLIQHGIVPHKSGTEHIPQDVPRNLYNHFIRGFWDGDGSILFYPEQRCNPKTVACCSLSYNIIQSIIQVFQEQGIEISLTQSKTKNCILYVVRSQNYTNIEKIIHYLYDGATVYLQRKYDTAMQILNYISSSH